MRAVLAVVVVAFLVPVPAQAGTRAKPGKQAKARDDAWLGVILGGGRQGGVGVQQALPTTPARQAGILDGDEIMRVGPHRVRTASELVDAIKKYRIGATLPVEVYRNGQPIIVRVTLGKKPGQGDIVRMRTINQPFQSFNLEQVGTKSSIAWEDLRGEIVVLATLGPHCSDCVGVYGALHELEEAGAVVLGIASGRRAELEQFVRDGGPPFAVLDDRHASIARHYMITSMPMIFVVDRSGLVIDIGSASRTELARVIDSTHSALRSHPHRAQLSRQSLVGRGRQH